MGLCWRDYMTRHHTIHTFTYRFTLLNTNESTGWSLDLAVPMTDNRMASHPNRRTEALVDVANQPSPLLNDFRTRSTRIDSTTRWNHERRSPGANSPPHKPASRKKKTVIRVCVSVYGDPRFRTPPISRFPNRSLFHDLLRGILNENRPLFFWFSGIVFVLSLSSFMYYEWSLTRQVRPGFDRNQTIIRVDLSGFTTRNFHGRILRDDLGFNTWKRTRVGIFNRPSSLEWKLSFWG